MKRTRTKTRIAALSLGLVLLLTGAALVAASFAFEAAYLRNNTLAVAWARTAGPSDQPLIYPGYETDLEESAIRLMNVGIWIGFGGVACVILSRAKARRSRSA